MTDKERTTEILKSYTKKHNIAASSVILEEYAEEFVKNDVIKVVRCKDCTHFVKRHEKPSFCFLRRRHIKENDFCSDAELRSGLNGL